MKKYLTGFGVVLLLAVLGLVLHVPYVQAQSACEHAIYNNPGGVDPDSSGATITITGQPDIYMSRLEVFAVPGRTITSVVGNYWVDSKMDKLESFGVSPNDSTYSSDFMGQLHFVDITTCVFLASTTEAPATTDVETTLPPITTTTVSTTSSVVSVVSPSAAKPVTVRPDFTG